MYKQNCRPGTTSNVSPHDIYDSCPNQAVFYDKREEIWGRVLHNGAHDIDTTTYGSGVTGGIADEGLGKQTTQVLCLGRDARPCSRNTFN